MIHLDLKKFLINTPSARYFINSRNYAIVQLQLYRNYLPRNLSGTINVSSDLRRAGYVTPVLFLES